MSYFALAKERREERETEIRIRKCEHEMENLSTYREPHIRVCTDDTSYEDSKVYTIIRCKKACGYTKKVYAK